MAYLDWDKRFSVGVKILNEDHQKLFNYINILYDGLRNELSEKELGDLLGDLADYTVKHFSHEEILMEKYDYPKFSEHKVEHDDLVQKVVQIQDDFIKGQNVLNLSLLGFLKKWVEDHILKSDMEYKDFFVNIAKNRR